MDVKEFIESSLIQIIEGINGAKDKLKGSDVLISSKDVRPLREGTTVNHQTGNLVNLIEFDMAVTVNEKDTSGGKAGINIVGLNIGGGLQNEVSNQTVSRIKFSVPVTFAP